MPQGREAACTGWASPDFSSTHLAWGELREKDGGSFFPGLRPRLAERPSGERGTILSKEDNGAFEGKAAGAPGWQPQLRRNVKHFKL